MQGILPKALKDRRQPSVWDFTLDLSPEGIWRSPADRACVQQSALFSATKQREEAPLSAINLPRNSAASQVEVSL